MRRITHKVLSKKSREFLLATMSRTRTGAGRIKAFCQKEHRLPTKQELLAVSLMTWVS
jgi:hypothetical protein